jgi:hypothetical protein
MKKKKGNLLTMLRGILFPAAAMLAVFCLLTAVANLSGGSTEQGRKRLEDTLRRACVTCYATEGVYPPTLQYLEEHYGVQIDGRRYTVSYDAFGSNLMPDITVLENGG